MILTRKMIDEMRRYSRIDECVEQMLLEQLGTEPYPHVYTEQDIYEQSRKMIQRYNAFCVRITAQSLKADWVFAEFERIRKASYILWSMNR